MKPALLLAAALIPLSPVLAQPPGPPPGRPDAAEMERHRADIARDLATVLALKPGQRPALDAWLGAMGPPPPPPPRPSGDATTPQRLQERQARLAERQQREEAGIAATKRFYASLDPRQQQVFDALERLRHEGRHGPHDDHRPGRDGPPPPPPAG